MARVAQHLTQYTQYTPKNCEHGVVAQTIGQLERPFVANIVEREASINNSQRHKDAKIDIHKLANEYAVILLQLGERRVAITKTTKL